MRRHRPVSAPDRFAPLVELDGVSMAYAGRDGSRIELFESLSVSVARGDSVVLAGRSGSGKTTALNIACGLLAPTTGAVRWLGEPLARLSSDDVVSRRANLLGIVFQGSALIETLTAAENVALAAIGSKARASEARVIELLDRVGVGSRARHFPAQLSGGEQQRVAVARALYADPPLLVVDEPTANLDRGNADGMVELLVALRVAGRGLLIASHDTHVINAATEVIELETYLPVSQDRPTPVGRDQSGPVHFRFVADADGEIEAR